jgi:two-component system chemotaxis sensor kinase CheA
VAVSREDRRAALLARFRVSAFERIAGMLGRLGVAALAPADLAALRGDLHTLKGEARMLGLPSLAGLVHAIEDWLADRHTVPEPEGIARTRSAIELLGERLAAELVEGRDAELALARGRAILAGEAKPVVASPRANADPSGFSLVDSATLDQLCDRLEQLRAALHRLGPALPELDPLRVECGELTELAWSLRMVAVEPALRSLAAYAEELAARLDKQVRVEVDTGGAELERSLLERLREPLMHLVHNAIDHGIERQDERGSKPAVARLTIATRSLGRELEFVVADDGQGIDRQRVRARAVERGLIDAAGAVGLGDDELLALLFASGFSTTTRVGELSGRGVGLDVVRRVVESLGGHVEVRSEPGKTTEFTLRVPATISRERVVVIEFGRGLWGLPARRVGPILALRDRVVREGGNSTVLVDGQHIPLLSLAGLLGIKESRPETMAICCTHGGIRHALACPALLGEHELFRLPLGPTLASVGPASASAMLDDGRLVLLVEPSALLRVRRVRTGEGPSEARFVQRYSTAARPRVLVVEDSAIVRELLVELLTASSLEVEADEDGQAALERLDRSHFDLVVTDIEMPRLDGFELLGRIRERHGDLPVIVASTRSSASDRQRAVALGADAWIVKSEFSEHSLLDAVERFVEVVR